MATILTDSVNSSDPETAIFVLPKASIIECCLFLKESPAVAREDALQPIYISSYCTTDVQGHPRSMTFMIFMSFESQYVTSY